jgi:oligopeptide transport system substrate-binding protein
MARRRPLTISLLAMLFALALAMAMAIAIGCTGAAKPKPGVLRVQLATEPVSLDPTLAEDGASMRVLANTWSGLDRLAAKIDLSKDGRTYVIALAPGARWSDGPAVTAEHFVAGLKRSLSKEAGAKLAPMLYPIRGAREFHQGKSRELPGVKARDGKLVIELERPAPYFAKALALSIAYPQRPDVLAANGGAWPALAPTTGPYRVSEHVRGQMLVLTRNGETPAGGVSRVEMRIVSDDSAALALFERGELDVLTRVPTLDLQRLLKMGVVRTDPYVATYYVAFNVRKPPFDRLEWRRAVAHAVRKTELAKAVATGETPARSWIPIGMEGYEPFDAVREQQPPIPRTVAEAMARSAPVEAAFDSSSRNSLVMEKVQHDVRQATGLRLSLTNLDWKSYIGRLQSDAPPMFRFAWLAPFMDPVPHLQVFVTRNPNNYTGWSNARYDALVAKVETLAPGIERAARIVEAQKILLEEEVAVVPLYHYVQNHGVSARVHGFRATPMGAIPFAELTLAEAP